MLRRGIAPLLGRPASLIGRRAFCSAPKQNIALGAVENADDIPTLKLYRDCMKLTYHIAGASAKGDAMRQMVRGQFRSNMQVEDPKEIQRLKMLGIVGLQNYVIHESTGKAIEKRRQAAKSDKSGGGGEKKS